MSCNDTATPEIYTYCHTLSLHDALPICWSRPAPSSARSAAWPRCPSHPHRSPRRDGCRRRSEEDTSELQSLMGSTSADFCWQNKMTQASKYHSRKQGQCARYRCEIHEPHYNTTGLTHGSSPLCHI